MTASMYWRQHHSQFMFLSWVSFCIRLLVAASYFTWLLGPGLIFLHFYKVSHHLSGNKGPPTMICNNWLALQIMFNDKRSDILICFLGRGGRRSLLLMHAWFMFLSWVKICIGLVRCGIVLYYYYKGLPYMMYAIKRRQMWTLQEGF